MSITPFTERDIAIAAAFAKVFNVPTGNRDEGIKLESVDAENDSIVVGPFTITRFIGERRTLASKQMIEAEMYDVVSSSMTYSHHSGYDVDLIELAKCATFIDALKVCAHQALDWAIDNTDFLPEPYLKED